MRIRTLCFRMAMAVLFAAPSVIHAQPPAHAAAPAFTSIPAFPFGSAGPVIRAHTESAEPFTVSGERGVLLGQQDGTFEAWLLPVKVLSHLTIEADVQDYTVPIDVNQQSAEIEVRPDRTVITYSHIAFTVRQIMFSPVDAPPGTGPVVLFQFDCVRPTDFTLRFTPELRWMWPERSEGTPNVEWVAPGQTPHDVAGGFYVLHSDYPDLAAATTIPGARAGILAPYQERPQVHPVELKLHIDPARDSGRLFPLLMAVGTNTAAANSGALGATLEKLNQGVAAAYAAHAESYRKLLENSVSIRTPDKALDDAFQWAEVSIEQLKAKPVGTDETALVAGYYASGDSARPGFGWFFGRDALYTLYAVNGYGDFGLAKSELEFLIHRQRADGKIMHEYSQTAGAIDWQQFPYMYAAADSTPLFLLAVLDYVKASGDTGFVAEHRDAIEKAWAFETSHADPNGIYANTQGTGWVESWPGGMPHQEIYLALLDQQASAAIAQLYDLLHDTAKAQSARARANAVAGTINTQFYDAEKCCYAFSRNTNGSLDRTTTVYPALAWWSNLSGTTNASGSILAHPEGCLRQLASHTLNTDWGLRDVSNEEKIYDGMSYHQGSVWPLFTGWAAMAEYRGGQPLSGYQMLMENADLTGAQDLGAITELLSGDFFVPFGRSTSHQLWSSAMVITPILRGLFGVSIDALSKTITVNPHLPAEWNSAELDNIRLPEGSETLRFSRSEDVLEVHLSDPHSGWKLRSDVPGTKAGADASAGIRIPVPDVEVSESVTAPLPGSRTAHVRVVSESQTANRLTLVFEGKAGEKAGFRVVRHRVLPRLHFDCPDQSAATCAPISDAAKRDPRTPLDVSIHFPEGEGWKTTTVTLTW